MRPVAAFAKVAATPGRGRHVGNRQQIGQSHSHRPRGRRVAGGIVAALGTAAPRLLSGAQWLATYILEPLGQVFLRMLFFVVIPLVFASLANGILQLHELSQLGPLAARTFVLFFLNMAIAVTLGLS